jgi:hypothetical protein
MSSRRQRQADLDFIASLAGSEAFASRSRITSLRMITDLLSREPLVDDITTTEREAENEDADADT